MPHMAQDGTQEWCSCPCLGAPPLSLLQAGRDNHPWTPLLCEHTKSCVSRPPLGQAWRCLAQDCLAAAALQGLQQALPGEVPLGLPHRKLLLLLLEWGGVGAPAPPSLPRRVQGGDPAVSFRNASTRIHVMKSKLVTFWMGD